MKSLAGLGEISKLPIELAELIAMGLGLEVATEVL
jgi:hypothetical protein